MLMAMVIMSMVRMVIFFQTTATNGRTRMEMAMVIMQMASKVINSNMNHLNGSIPTRMVTEIIQTASRPTNARTPTGSRKKTALAVSIQILTDTQTHLPTGLLNKVLMHYHSKVPSGGMVMVMAMATTSQVHCPMIATGKRVHRPRLGLSIPLQ